MPTTIEIIAPFFNDNTTAPPPFPPLLTDQQELLGGRSHPSGLLADEALYSGALTITAKPDLNVFPTPRPSTPAIARPFKVARGPSPYSRKAVGSTKNLSGGHASSSELSNCSSESSSDSDEASSTSSEYPKIPKPAGEPGRPGRGGYNLETALNWDRKPFTKFKVSSTYSA